MDQTSPIVVCFVTLGCAKNLVDAEVMCGTLAVNGIYLTTDQEEADLIIINTCSFIQDARKEAENAIRQALKWRARGRRQGIMRGVAVAGCLPQRNPRECAEKYPEVDFFIGLDDLTMLPDLIRKFFAGDPDSRHIPSGGLPTYLYDDKTPRITVTPESYAFIKIAEGCDHRCAFCAIPGIRGHLRSRLQSSVLEECRLLLDNGAHELNLIAQDTSSFGHDAGARKENLSTLLREIDKLPGEFWVRVLYTHPCHMNDELLDVLASGNHIVPYLDMPLQHINDAVLTNMRRRMGGSETRKLVEHIRADYPGLFFRTTLLTGFPGETQEAYEELRSFVREIRFDRMGVFSYSPEEGTPGAAMTEGLVVPTTATRRRNELLAIQKTISREKNAALVGQVMKVLVDEELGGRQLCGRTAADAPEVDQQVILKAAKGRKSANRFATVKITGSSEYDLQGEEI